MKYDIWVTTRCRQMPHTLTIKSINTGIRISFKIWFFSILIAGKKIFFTWQWKCFTSFHTWINCKNRLKKRIICHTFIISFGSWLNTEARETPEDTEGTLWERDSVLLQPPAGLHQRSQSGRQHAGHVQQAQLDQAVFPGWICSGAGENPQRHAQRSSEGGETQLYQAQGKCFGFLSFNFKSFIAIIIEYEYQEFNEFKRNRVLLACPWRK